jgi:hypothetical protein
MENPNLLIKEALQYSVNEINKGTNPTEALKKAAEYYDLKYDFIQRTGEGLNTALYYNHYKTASDKAAEFPLADIQGVIKELYNENEKTANHFNSEQFPPVELFNPIPDLDKIFTSPLHKEAYLKIADTPKNQPNQLSDKAVLEKSAHYIAKLEKEAMNAKIAKIEAKNNMEACFFNLADSFRKDAGHRTSFEEFESQAISKFGEEITPMLDLLYKQARLTEERGIHDKGYQFFDNCPELNQLEKFYKYSDEMLASEKEAEDAEYNVKFEKDYIAEIYKQAEELKKKPTELTLSSTNEGQDKYAGFLDEIFKNVAEKAKGEAPKKPSVSGNSVMDNFERQAILQDLLLRDPILKKENHSDVIAAFEQVVKIAPQVALQKEVLKAILRQMVSGQALAPHAAGQISELDLSLLKQKLMALNQ